MNKLMKAVLSAVVLLMVSASDAQQSVKTYVTTEQKIRDLIGQMTLQEKVSLLHAKDILVGYRWFDTKKIQPQFPFGYGLSYTNFSIGHFSTDKPGYGKNDIIHATFTIENTGSAYGAEVAQLYVSDPVCSVLRPEKELKAFEKIFLKPGESKTVTLQVKVADLAFYDESKRSWNTEAGEYLLQLGNSSRNIFQKVKISVK